MKSKAEKCFSLPLKYPEVQDFQVTVSCSSSQWIFSSESGGHDVLAQRLPCFLVADAGSTFTRKTGVSPQWHENMLHEVVRAIQVGIPLWNLPD